MKVHKRMVFETKFIADFLNYQYEKAKDHKPWSANFEVELIVALICVKAYGLTYEGHFKIAFPHKASSEHELNNATTPTIEEFESFLKKFQEQSTLIDIILMRELPGNEHRLINLQIKRFGLGKEKGSDTNQFIEFLKKYTSKTVKNENRLIVLREKISKLKPQEIVDWLNTHSISFPEVILLHQKENNDMEIYQLKPNTGTFAVKLLSRNEIINV